MHTHVGDVPEPLSPLLLEIRVVEKHPTLDEIVSEVARLTLEFALGLGLVRPARTRRNRVVREAEKVEVPQRASRVAAAGRA